MLWRIMLWLNRKEVENMAVIYVALIVKGKRTYASVPAVLKEQVKEMLIDLEQSTKSAHHRLDRYEEEEIYHSKPRKRWWV